MTYAASLQFLYSLQTHGIKLGLDTIEALLDRIGRPHCRYPTLHIGGTNGKGSTAAMAASMLQAAGHRVGLYTSPHLVDFRERIRVDGRLIPADAVVDWTERLRAAMGDTLAPTFFEFTTAMAFGYFADMEVGVAVIEVGMGGRFDATNVLMPLASAITNVTLDHEAYLGRTVPAIAFEKAGIIKPHVPVVVGRVGPDAWAVIDQAAASRTASTYRWQTAFHTVGNPLTGFIYKGMSVSYADLVCPLPGQHQLENAGCAVALIELLSARGVSMTEHAVRVGLRTVSWEGRLEVVEHGPDLILDGGHNPAAGTAVAEYLKHYRMHHPAARVILVVGFMRDKDRAGFFNAVLPAADEVVLTHVNMARAATIEEIHETLQGWPGHIHSASNPVEALACARRLASPYDLICVTGSLMLVGEVKALLRGCDVSLLRG
ncbi:MAG TPA: folylpolyglutamate synthase/dihydrofolate synthase family protein [Nitrospiraceae bacterium]|nr:folylpolyglutamate synthase/dihydrofolate synthase family protein [Nitrospiraceae bacterium]